MFDLLIVLQVLLLIPLHLILNSLCLPPPLQQLFLEPSTRTLQGIGHQGFIGFADWHIIL
jgi:hypothetical protein